MLQAVTFDFWGTLYQNADAHEERISLLDDVLREHGHDRSRAELQVALDHVSSIWDRVWRTEQRSMPIERWLGELLDELDADLPDESAHALGWAIERVYLHIDEPRPVARVKEVLPGLARHYRLGLISDTGLTPGSVLRQVMHRDSLLSLFEVLTFSDELGKAKPRPEPFLHTINYLDASPGQAAHIGDLPETDLRGARGVGMKAVLFLGVSQREDGRPLADAVFSDYTDLPALLEELA